jgi:uncharacterized membrane protein
MKRSIVFVLLIVSLLGACLSTKNEIPTSIGRFFLFEYERTANPNSEQLSIVRYVLKNTYENNIHKMRGEVGNRVYVNDDGREAVFDKYGNLVTNSYNRGSYNYFSNVTEPIKKFIFDITPWLESGNSRDDPTTFNERMYYYTLDLDYGIQSYIFEGSNEALETVSFNELSEDEKEVYYFFIKLLFNEQYKIKLSRENIQRLRDDGRFYYEYFYQIQEMLNVKQ